MIEVVDSAANKEMLSQKMLELGERFLRRSLVDARHILDNLQASDALNNQQTRDDLVALAHRLVGTAATLGFHDLSDHAAELETQLAALANSTTNPAANSAAALQNAAAQVLQEITRLAHERAIT